MRLLALTLTALGLTACGGGEETEAASWMDETRKSMRPTTQPVPEPKQFAHMPYEGKALIDPFDAQKMVLAVLARLKRAPVRARSSPIWIAAARRLKGSAGPAEDGVERCASRATTSP